MQDPPKGKIAFLKEPAFPLVSIYRHLKGPSCEKRFAAHNERQGNNQNQMPGEALINQSKPDMQ